ncbi:MAG: flagellar biosynthesis anti-sigma factor FlgM [Thermodesulfobacteriota bacterium]|nr:flagellar biosynthesis anti-sigma factor FlgM [Thermodesulfobacteriota bacterium]
MDIKKPAKKPRQTKRDNPPDIQEHAAAGASNDRAELLESLRKQVQSGTYKTDIQRLTLDLLLNDLDPLI